MLVKTAIKEIENILYKSDYPLTEENKFIDAELSMYVYHITGNTGFLLEAYGYGVYTNKQYLLNELIKSLDKGEEVNTYFIAQMYSSGELGYTDYEKAFYYYTRALTAPPQGGGSKSIEDAYFDCRNWANYKLALMYRDGLYVEKDYAKYQEMIRETYEKTKVSEYPYDSYDAHIEMARILFEENKIEEASEILLNIRPLIWFFVTKVSSEIDELISINELLYKYCPFDTTEIQPIDITYLLKDNNILSFYHNDQKYFIYMIEEEDCQLIQFGQHFYSSIENFMKYARIEGESFCSALPDTYGWEVL